MDSCLWDQKEDLCVSVCVYGPTHVCAHMDAYLSVREAKVIVDFKFIS